MYIKELEGQLLFSWIDDVGFRTRLSYCVNMCKSTRKETQKDISKWTGISLTKVKEIENGACKDFNSINNYINYLNSPLLT